MSCLIAATKTKKPKYHKSVAPAKVWVFCLLDTSKTPSCGYMQIVEQCNAETLPPIN